MMTDPVGERSSSGFPTAQPMQALEKDHDFVKQLFERYLSTQDRLVKREAGPHILMLLEMHAAVEEATFYPAVQHVNTALVDECKEQHEEADQLIRQLKGMDPSDPQCDRLFRQLRDAVLHHIDVEEHQLFPAVRKANLDLETIGLQMQAYESSMVAAQAQASGRDAKTFNPDI
ncbi:MAG TPA: hemerythrin domain-containing protein [Burkholderiaceae bacterium]|nr:hemerythrin domain-containing protein [Burkholderiaceae bacterium]